MSSIRYANEQRPFKVPVLFQVVLTLERLAADLAGERHVVLVAALVDHQVVRFSESALAVLADKLALGPHLATKLPPVVTFYLHNREHGGRYPLAVSQSQIVFCHNKGFSHPSSRILHSVYPVTDSVYFHNREHGGRYQLAAQIHSPSQ